MSGSVIAFFALSIVAIFSSLLVLYLNKVVQMVVAIVFTFLSIAGVYILLSAEFLAAAQVLLYSGAITIMMLFGIMLTKHDDDTTHAIPWVRRGAILASLVAFFFCVYVGISSFGFPTMQDTLHVNNTEQIGIALYTHYIIPFELLSVLLLAALVGAIVIAKKENTKEEEK